jgi:hypothetical protein
MNVCETLDNLHEKCPGFSTLYADHLKLGPVACICDCHRAPGLGERRRPSKALKPSSLVCSYDARWRGRVFSDAGNFSTVIWPRLPTKFGPTWSNPAYLLLTEG